VELRTFEGAAPKRPFSALTTDTHQEYMSTLCHLVIFLTRVHSNDDVAAAGMAQVLQDLEGPIVLLKGDQRSAQTIRQLLLRLLTSPHTAPLLWFLRISTVKEGGNQGSVYRVRQQCVALMFMARLVIFCDLQGNTPALFM